MKLADVVIILIQIIKYIS